MNKREFLHSLEQLQKQFSTSSENRASYKSEHCTRCSHCTFCRECVGCHRCEYICPTERAVCPNMKKITLDKVIWSLEKMAEHIKIDEQIRTKAKKALDRMVEILPTG